MKKEQITIRPNPDRVLIKITKHNWNSIFSKYVKMPDGKEVEIFIDIEEASGYERRFHQNVSVGTVVGIGENVQGVQMGDMAIIDYIVTATDDYTVGFVNGEKIVAIPAHTTYHTEDCVPNFRGMNAYKEGDFDEISLLYGVVRNKVAYSRSPYVFLFHENPLRMEINSSGLEYQKMDEICYRTVMASNDNSICKPGDKVIVNADDISERIIDNHTLSVIFEQDIIGVI